MLDNEVPQEGNATLGGHSKAVYARGADGKLHLVQSAGWEVEEIVTKQAVDDLNRLAADARQRALAGQTSALEYHMHKARMDVAMLAQTTGLFQWRIRRHFRPDIFATLSDALLARYAEVMGISLEQLKKVD
ncbi:hypothetical protein [Quatrionicoccus australiensis]|uniref:hypothetical protein n=1 Tax=Quatrionicoccus australiensis TaxID=138118 RepID=UPI001CF82543|nr:hypothetical protein [Quatrionicoccus australiensis]UCV13364.1 hypothetical protein KI612_10275 [Quatrionicoccus australiensis]